MLHQEWKSEYISCFEHREAKKLEQVFNRVSSEIEDIYNKDVCNLSYEEVLNGLSTLKLKTRAHTSRIIYVLKKYTEWCIENGLSDTSNNVYSLIHAKDIDISASITSSIINSYDEMAAYFDSVFKPCSQNSMDNIYRAALWMTFFGVAPEGLLTIKQSDYHDNVIEYDDMIIDLKNYPEADKAIWWAINQERISKGLIEERLENTPFIIRFSVRHSNNDPFRRLQTGISKAITTSAKYNNVEIYSFGDIAKSGLFWRMNNAETQAQQNSILNRYIYGRYDIDNAYRMKIYMKEIISEYKAWQDNK